MKPIALRDLPPGATRVKSLGFAPHPDGLRLGAVAGGETTTAAVRWLQIPAGDEFARRDLVTTGRPVPVLSPDLAALAYQRPGDELVLERPFDSPPQLRAVPEAGLNSMSFTPDGKELYAVADNGVYGWDTGPFFTAGITENEGFGARCLYNSEGGATGRVSAAAGSGMYAMAHPDGFVIMHYGGDWSGGIQPPAGTAGVTALAFTNAAGDHLIVAHGAVVGVYAMTYEDRDLDFDEVYQEFALPDHPATVTGIAMTPDGSQFATCCADGVVRFWDAETGEARRVFDWGSGELTAVAFSPDGQLGAVGTADGRVLLWDLA